MGTAQETSSRRGRTALVLLWPPFLATVLVLPLVVRPGHPLARDLVFVPRQVFNDATWGLGEVAPRAVPLDAVVAALTQLVDGGHLARVVLPLSLSVLGWGVARLLAPLGTGAQVAGAGFAVWNVFVVERLALGQWAFLLGCAALPWLTAAAMRYRRDGRRADLASALAWTALASLTPTGGLLAIASGAAMTVPHLRRSVTFVGVGAVLQAPWLVAAVTGPATTTSAGAGVAAFAPDTESSLGPFVALAGLGGIWDARAEPASQATWLVLVPVTLVVTAVVVGLPVLWRCWGRGDTLRWIFLAATAATLSVLVATSWGSQLMVHLVESVPGAGLLRDAQKFLAPAVVLVSAAFGALASRILGAISGTDVTVSAALVLVLAPVLAVPDATTVTWPTVTPVRFPAELGRVAERLAQAEGRVITLPWRAYRAFEWGRPGLTASDPLIRMADADVITSDSLQVGRVLVPGEAPVAAAIGEAVEHGVSRRALAEVDVAWVVLYADDRDAGTVDTTGLELVLDGDLVELYRVPGVGARGETTTATRRTAVLAAHAVALLVALTVLALAGARTVARAAARRERDADVRSMYPNAR